MPSKTALCFALFAGAAVAQPLLAPTPPMGWNSWDSFGTGVTEEEVKANADFDQKAASASKELFTRGNQMAWVAEMQGSPAKYLAVFNIGDGGAERIKVDWSELGLSPDYSVRDLWEKRDLGTVAGGQTFEAAPHASAFYKIAPAKAR